MSQHPQRNIDNMYYYLDNTVPTYFDFKEGYLDMHTMRYRMFGAVWKLVDGRKYILGYWFADKANEIYRYIQEAGYSVKIKAKENEINEIYQSIRKEQDKQNWSKRCRLHFLSIMKKPWKDLRIGWYILKSRNTYPMTLTCVQKKQYSIWIEHIKVCETDEDIKKFLNLVNLEHNIKLIFDNIRINEF